MAGDAQRHCTARGRPDALLAEYSREGWSQGRAQGPVKARFEQPPRPTLYCGEQGVSMAAPSASPGPANAAQPASVRDRVQSVINWLRPIIQSDGGDLELVDVT